MHTTYLIKVATYRFLLQQSLLKELALMHGHTKAGEYGKSLQELLQQPLAYLHQLSLHFSGLYYLRYETEFPKHKKNEKPFCLVTFFHLRSELDKSFSLQILQMLNDPNPGVREAAIVCIEVSDLELIATMGILVQAYVNVR